MSRAMTRVRTTSLQTARRASIYWIPSEADGSVAASAEVTFTVYQRGAAAVQGVVNLVRVGNSYQYLAFLTQIKSL